MGYDAGIVEAGQDTENKCLNCEALDHRQKECPAPFKCGNCEGLAHCFEDCLDARDNTCFKRGQIGHKANDCPNPKELGHHELDCPKRDDKDQHTYIPKTMARYTGATKSEEAPKATKTDQLAELLRATISDDDRRRPQARSYGARHTPGDQAAADTWGSDDPAGKSGGESPAASSPLTADGTAQAIEI